MFGRYKRGINRIWLLNKRSTFGNSYNNTYFNCNVHVHSNSVQIPPPLKLSFNKIEVHDSNKPPLLILHGLFGNKTNWKSLSKLLSQSTNRTTYAIDLRNHGDSPHSDKLDTTTAHYAIDVKALIDDEGIKKCSLLGHSMGSRVANQFCFLFPELLEKVVCVDMTPVPSISGRKERIKEVLGYVDIMRDAIKDEKLTNLPLVKARKIVDQLISPVVKEKFVRDFLLLNLVKDGNNLRWKFNLDSCQYTLYNLYNLINVHGTFDSPILMIYGSKSDFFNDQEKDEINKLYTNAKYHCVHGAGHYLHMEKQDEFLDIVTRFLNFDS